MYLKLTLVAGLFLTFVDSDPVPFITKCKTEDTKCITESSKKTLPIFAAGLPEYRVDPSDPMTIKFADASSQNLKFLLSDIKVTGLKSCIPLNVQRDANKSKLFVKLECTALFDSHYEMNGHLLFLPIEGNGNLHVDLKKTVFDVEMDIVNKEGKDGKNHWNVKKWNFTFDLKDRSNVVFENLFNGNEVLAKAANDVIAKSGNEVILEIGSPAIKAVIAKVVENINHLFRAVPSEDLSID